MTKTTSAIVALPLAVTAGLLPLVTAAPAFAAAYAICVNTQSASCDDTAASINAAVAAADARIGAETILVGAGTYQGPFDVYGDVTLKGSGPSATILTMPASASKDEYVTVNGATIRDLTVKLAAAESSNDSGIVLWNGAAAVNVRVDGAGTVNSTGIEAADATIADSTVQLPLGSDSTGIYGEGGTTITDTTIRGNSGFTHSGGGVADTLSRVSIKTSSRGISTDSGTVNVDDTVIDLGSSGATALTAANYNASTSPKAINANHVTIVGGGDGSRGAYAAAYTQTVLQVSTITILNSIVRGPETDLSVMAGNNGSVGGNSVASITVGNSNWSTKAEFPQPHGTAQVLVAAGNRNVNPRFVNAAAANYRLAPSSPLVDRGNPAAGGPTSDVTGADRVFDGDANGSAVRDMGAYERTDLVAPKTLFTQTPVKRVTKAAVTFKFRSNESGATFRCKVDSGNWRSCTSPKSLTVKVGKHVVRVRATDRSGNTDRTPATYEFTRVR
jgi:hypothetical protein